MAEALSEDALASICSLVSDISEHKSPSLKDCLKDHKELDRAREQLLSCRELNKRLLSLAHSVFRRQRILEENVVVPAMNHLGIQKIPEELLARVAEMLPHEDRIRCCLVSHRFRDTLLATPSLWTEIRYSMHQNIISRLLFLSKDAPLHLIMDSDKTPVNPQKMLLLLKHRKRWHRVSFEATFFDIMETIPAPDFSAVKCMSLPSFEDNVDPDRDEEEGFVMNSPTRGRFYKFLKENKNPVTELVLREDIEPNPSLFPSLTHLRLVLDRPSLFREEELFVFLARRCQLEYFSVEIDATTADYEHLECRESNMVVRLPGLKQLHISMRMDPEDEDDGLESKSVIDSQEALTKAFCNLIHCFDIPNVESIEIGWTQDDNTYEEETMAPLPLVSSLFRSKNMEKLKRLQLTLNPFSERQTEEEILPFLMSMKDCAPNLNEVSCRMPIEFVEKNARRTSIIPPTSSILKLVDDFNDYFVREEVMKLKRRQNAIRDDGFPIDIDGVCRLLKGISFSLSSI